MNDPRKRHSETRHQIIMNCGGREKAMKRITTLTALILCGLLALPCDAQSEKRPNIIIILVDDMGWSDIASYGGEIPTPNLDALPKNGGWVTQFFHNAGWSPATDQR